VVLWGLFGVQLLLCGCLVVPWGLFDGCSAFIWRLGGPCFGGVCWLFRCRLMAGWWFFLVIWWLFSGCLVVV